MSNVVLSLIRTYVPVGVGAALAWLLTLGVELDPETQTGLITALTALIIAVYYSAARALERKWPWLGVLLGSRTQPEYDQRTTTEKMADDLADADRRSIVDALDYDPRIVPAPDADGHVRWAEPDTKGRHEA